MIFQTRLEIYEHEAKRMGIQTDLSSNIYSKRKYCVLFLQIEIDSHEVTYKKGTHTLFKPKEATRIQLRKFEKR